ncbi:secretory pathway Sec39 [Polyplosphaeria fusca]|uniref:Secretory pathway Sec39 n=1 Tax=Polyplosphaeria fusca TaxID=682080 RepID=A0A9P4V6Y9_9PLEO|nr:secretory pathway Sec39 [Polyplosphaeria fusca]
MAHLRKLSASHCVLLAAHYASESDVSSLRTLTALREADLGLDLLLRILLTYLPDSTEPSHYVGYLADLAASELSSIDYETSSLDLSSVQHVSPSSARRGARKLFLLPLAHPLYQNESSLDPLTQFLIHRSHRIDAETGLLDLVPQLVTPFLHHSEYLRTWFVSNLLPLLRLGYEYYPTDAPPSLETFVQLRGRRAIDALLANLKQAQKSPNQRDPARDLRGMVGPWTCGATARKRRKLDVGQRRASIDTDREQEADDWEYLFVWLARQSKEDLPLVASAIADWDGPGDVDFGGFDEGQVYIDDDRQRQLELRYAQVALASLYMIEDSSPETIGTAHSILSRLNTLLNFDPPSDLVPGVEALPVYDLKSPLVPDPNPGILQDEKILERDNPATQPDRKATRIMELLIFSAFIFARLQYTVSVRDVARMYLRDDRTEQLALLQKILHSISSGPKKDVEYWRSFRRNVLWLWGWGCKNQGDSVRHGQGILGLVEERIVHIEILKALLENGHYALAVQIYVQDPSTHRILPLENVEKVVLEAIMHYYDNATNGNRTRGGMRRASDVVSIFSQHFPQSTRFQRIQALLAAAHAMSFYSLTLQHGVLFQPVNIRVTADPLSLLRKLLAQNSGSYTNLDDMISIGQNLVISKPSTILEDDKEPYLCDPAVMEKKKAAVERRVIGMAIEAALHENDFETAYSYVINRLHPSSSPVVSPAASNSSQHFSFSSDLSSKEEEEGEDVAWRAALMAGRHQSTPSSSATWSNSAPRSDLRRLEQRMELLSQALLLAPPSHLEEVLAVWQQCEGEMTHLLTQDAAEEERLNVIADRRLPGAFGNETIPTVQPRREVGRGATEEAPMGLFDVARGAAAAFSKSAFPLRGNSLSASRTSNDFGRSQTRTSTDLASDSESMAGLDDGQRVRKRDMVASAVTGGLASGIGWVLGAKPVTEQERD